MQCVLLCTCCALSEFFFGSLAVLGDEKHMAAEFGHRLRCGYSETLDPKDFPTADEFVSRVNEMWPLCCSCAMHV